MRSIHRHQSINQSINQWINQSNDQWIDQPYKTEVQLKSKKLSCCCVWKSLFTRQSTSGSKQTKTKIILN